MNIKYRSAVFFYELFPFLFFSYNSFNASTFSFIVFPDLRISRDFNFFSLLQSYDGEIFNRLKAIIISQQQRALILCPQRLFVLIAAENPANCNLFIGVCCCIFQTKWKQSNLRLGRKKKSVNQRAEWSCLLLFQIFLMMCFTAEGRVKANKSKN